jgi:glycosyltransferase involved in cell wall biosynthesis
VSLEDSWGTFSVENAMDRFIYRIYRHIDHKFNSPRADLYWASVLAYPWIKASKKVVTIHDFSTQKHPEWHCAPELAWIREFFWKGIDFVDAIFTVSSTIKDELIQYGKVKNKPVYPIHWGIDHNFFRPLDAAALEGFKNLEETLPPKFILYVGSIQPRKNLINLMRAYDSLPDDFQEEYKLLLVGADGWKNDEILELIKKLEGNIVFLGGVKDKELVYLYNSAELSVYIPYYEGFGFPPLEAMACGTPVLVSDIPVIREVCGEGAAYADPYDIENIAFQIQNILKRDSVQKKAWREKGYLQASLYTWEKTAEQYKKHFLEVLSS